VSSPRPDHAPAATGAGDAWLSVCDELLWGFNHALSNRLAALTSLVRILEHSDTGLEPLLTVLSGEIGTLDRTLALLRLLPRNLDELAEPVRLQDVLPAVLELHRLQSDAREVEFLLDADEHCLPAWIQPSRLTHALLLLLARVSRATRQAEPTQAMIRCSGDDDEVRVVVDAAGARPDPASRERDGVLAAIEGLVGHAGGEVREARIGGAAVGGLRWELRLPSLLAVRRRERSAAGRET
jgi:hypothetical protein